MTKIIKIEKCEECPMFEKYYFPDMAEEYRCIRHKGGLIDLNIIPDWCSLTDVCTTQETVPIHVMAVRMEGTGVTWHDYPETCESNYEIYDDQQD